jgi:hypothetical protein
MGWWSPPKPPDPNPGLIASAQASERIAGEQLQLARDQFAWAQQQDRENWERIGPLIDQQVRIGNAQEARAQDYYDYERRTFRPLEERIVQEANEFDTEGKREELAGRASADVAQGFGIARDSAARNMARYGINPNSEKFASVNKDLTVAEGLARAGAKNNARVMSEEIGNARRMDAAAMGRGLAQNSSAAASLALGANQGAQAGQLNAAAAGNNMRLGGIGAFGAAQQGYGMAGNLYGASHNASMNTWQGNFARHNQRWNQWAAVDSAARSWVGMFMGGGMADGGPVEQDDDDTFYGKILSAIQASSESEFRDYEPEGQKGVDVNMPDTGPEAVPASEDTMGDASRNTGPPPSAGGTEHNQYGSGKYGKQDFKIEKPVFNPTRLNDGGEVEGPGTSRSDSIPARLSDGEYVVPAPVVRELGVKYFDRLIEKHGSDQNVAALERRRGGIKAGNEAHMKDGGPVERKSVATKYRDHADAAASANEFLADNPPEGSTEEEIEGWRIAGEGYRKYAPKTDEIEKRRRNGLLPIPRINAEPVKQKPGRMGVRLSEPSLGHRG